MLGKLDDACCQVVRHPHTDHDWSTGRACWIGSSPSMLPYMTTFVSFGPALQLHGLSVSSGQMSSTGAQFSMTELPNVEPARAESGADGEGHRWVGHRSDARCAVVSGVLNALTRQWELSLRGLLPVIPWGSVGITTIEGQLFRSWGIES